MNYDQYTLDDFLADDQFKNWVLAPTEAEDAFWKKWLQQHPEKRELVVQSKEIIQSLSQKDDDVILDAQSDRIWERLSTAVKERKEPRLQKTVSYKFMWSKIAAAIALLVISVFAFYWISTESHTIKINTRFSETKSVVLPDSSVIVLNANSSLQYQDEWNMNTPREVWLEGEAFFEVRNLSQHNSQSTKIKPGQRFIVHTDDISVEVLGTQFNINHRRNSSSVVLRKGSVKVKSNYQQADILLQPGERTEYSQTSQAFATEIVNPEIYTAWRNNQYMFEDTPIQEIATLLEDDHGMQVTVSEEVSKREITANVPSNNVEILLDLLAETLGVEITKQGKAVYIK